MKNKLRYFLTGKSAESFFSSAMAIVVGLIFGFLILLISNPAQAGEGFFSILTGGFTGGTAGISPKAMGMVLYYATPIIMTGLSVGFAFKTGIFNIGASGQFITGAFAAVYVCAKYVEVFGAWTWVVALFAAAVVGGLWALIPGLLNAYRNVNIVISCIVTNYIGMYLINQLVRTTVYDSLKNQSVALDKITYIPKLGLDQVFSGAAVNAGILIALVLSVVMYIVINKTTFGFELKACGYNRDASRYAGINEKRSIVFSMVIAGALAGIGGGLLYLAGSGKHINVVEELAAEGFTGIPVALLGLSNPIGVFFAGLFVAYIMAGGFYMQLFGFVPEIIDMIIAVIIYFSAFALLFRGVFKKIFKRRGGDDL